MAKVNKSNEGREGGLLKGDAHSAPSGGIKAVVTDSNNKPVLLEGEEVIINKKAVNDPSEKTLTGTNKEILHQINTSTGGKPILENGGKVDGSKEMRTGGEVSDQGKLFAASSRFKPAEEIVFKPPLIGPNGNKLTSYKWAYEWTMIPDKREGELKSKRVSDWSQAEENAETGRGIVHQYNIELKDGSVKTVSSETVPIILGFSTKEQSKIFGSLSTASKTLAKQQMLLSVMEAKLSNYESLRKKYESSEKPEIKEIDLDSKWKPLMDDWKAGKFTVFSMGDVSYNQDNEYVYETRSYKKRQLTRHTLDQLKAEWVSKRIKEDGGEYPRDLYDLRNRVSRQKRRVEAMLSSKMKTGGEVNDSEMDNFDWESLYNPSPEEKEKIKEEVGVREAKEKEDEYQRSRFSKKWAPTRNEAIGITIKEYLAAQDTYNDWASRSYKPNKSNVFIGGDDVFGEAKSIGSINEGRRQRVLRGSKMIMDESLQTLKELGLSDSEISDLMGRKKDGGSVVNAELNSLKKDLEIKRSYLKKYEESLKKCLPHQRPHFQKEIEIVKKRIKHREQDIKNLESKQMATGGSVDDTDHDDIYSRWKTLVNMSASELNSFLHTKEGKEAGLSRSEAKSQGINSGHESARWIIRMKNTPKSQWKDAEWKWAGKQVGFISRMSGNSGPLYDSKGNKTRKHTSLLLWGHNPEKKETGGKVTDSDVNKVMARWHYNRQHIYEKLVELNDKSQWRWFERLSKAKKWDKPMIKHANEQIALVEGSKYEMEHYDTIQKVYKHEITPEQAVTETAKTHIDENPDYYKELKQMEENKGIWSRKKERFSGNEVPESLFKVGDMVYSWQNKDYPARVAFREFRRWNSNGHPHENDGWSYKVTLKDNEGYTRSSKWMGEDSLSREKKAEYKEGGSVKDERNLELEMDETEAKLRYAKNFHPEKVHILEVRLQEIKDLMARDENKMENGGPVSLSEHDKSRLAELQKKEDTNSLLESENIEYNALVEKYRKTPDYKHYRPSVKELLLKDGDNENDYIVEGTKITSDDGHNKTTWEIMELTPTILKAKHIPNSPLSTDLGEREMTYEQLREAFTKGAITVGNIPAGDTRCFNLCIKAVQQVLSSNKSPDIEDQYEEGGPVNDSDIDSRANALLEKLKKEGYTERLVEIYAGSRGNVKVRERIQANKGADKGTYSRYHMAPNGDRSTAIKQNGYLEEKEVLRLYKDDLKKRSSMGDGGPVDSEISKEDIDTQIEAIKIAIEHANGEEKQGLKDHLAGLEVIKGEI